MHGEIAGPEDLSTVKEREVFFAPTFALDVPQADGRKRAFAHVGGSLRTACKQTRP